MTQPCQRLLYSVLSIFHFPLRTNSFAYHGTDIHTIQRPTASPASMRGYTYQKVGLGEAAADDDDDVPLHQLNKSSTEVTEPFISQPEGAHARKKSSVYPLLPYFFLSSLAFGLTMVPRLNMLVSLICRQMAADDITAEGMNSRGHEVPAGMPPGDALSGSNMSRNLTVPTSSMGSAMSAADDRCSSPEVLASVAFMSTFRDLIVGIVGAITSYYLGKLSDTLGRRKVMVINGIGIQAAELVLVLVLAFPETVDYRWLFLSFVLDGLSGSFPLLMATASSWVTDRTDEEDRIAAMGWIQAGMFCGMAIGPALGGALGRLGSFDRSWAIWLYSILCRTIALLCLTILPESLPKVSGRNDGLTGAQSHSHSSPWTLLSFKSITSFDFLGSILARESNSDESRRIRRNLILLIAINAIMFGTSVGAMDVMMLYPQAQYKWSMMDTGNFVSLINIFRSLSSLVIIRLLTYLFARARPIPSPTRDQEIKRTHLPLLRIALCSDVLGYLGWAVAPTGTFFAIAGVLSALSAMGISASQASTSMLVSSQHVGKLMGILGSIQALTRLVFPPAINLVYAWTVSFLPQAVFFGLAVLVAIGLIHTYILRL